jgi:hypothetical protein
LKKLVLGFAAAAALGIASFAVPASAATSAPAGISQSTDVSAARYVVRRKVVRRGPVYHRGYHRGPVCTVRKIVRRGPYGRRVVTTRRVCR